MIISKNVYPNVLSFRLVGVNGCASACQGKVTVVCLGFFSERWMIPRRRRNHNPIRFALGYCAHHQLHSNSTSVPTLFQCQSNWNAQVVYWTQAFVLGFTFLPPFKGMRSKPVIIADAHCPGWLPTLLTSHTSHSSVLLAKDEDASMCVGGSVSKIPLHYECL